MPSLELEAFASVTGRLIWLGLLHSVWTKIADRFRPVVLAVWLPVVAILGSILTLGARSVRRLCRESVPASKDIQQRTRRLARRLRLRKIPFIQIHASVGEPCLCGLFRPVIVLPGYWLASSRAEHLDAILAHELAHARRLDPLVNLMQRLVETLFFFHPAVHWLSRSLRRQREFCADALAVRLTGNPLALAESLESVARLRFRNAVMPAIAGASFGGETLSLLPRIQELIGMTPSRPRISFWPFAALPAGAFASFVAAAAERISGSQYDRAALSGIHRYPGGLQSGRQPRNSFRYGRGRAARRPTHQRKSKAARTVICHYPAKSRGRNPGDS